MRSLLAALSLAFLLAFPFTSTAQAKRHPVVIRHHHVAHHVRHVRYVRVRHHRSRAAVARAVPLAGNLVTVQTAANISITVAANLAGRFQAFIADLVASGYKPRHIGSFARGGHVANSRHYAGAALDIDQIGWNRTARPMYHVAALAAKHGLRDGCSFRRPDCGHVDDGASLHRRYARHRDGVRHVRKTKIAALRSL